MPLPFASSFRILDTVIHLQGTYTLLAHDHAGRTPFNQAETRQIVANFNVR